MLTSVLYFAGETGMGKSTLMDSLFNTNFDATPSPHTLSSVKLKAHTYELQESNVRLKVRFVLLLLSWEMFGSLYKLFRNSFLVTVTASEVEDLESTADTERAYCGIPETYGSGF